MTASENDFVTWATGAGANVMPQATYLVNPATNQGVSIGFADPTLYNKAQRQASFMAAMLALFIQNNQNNNVLDDGNLTEMLANYEAALTGWLYSGVIPVARIRLLANTNFYVGGTGANDNNLGTAAAPWATLQHAVNVINGQYDLAGFQVTVNCTGAFTSGFAVFAPFVGTIAAQNVVFNFASGSSISSTNAACVFAQAGAQFLIQGPVLLTASGTSGYGAGVAAYAQPGSNIIIGNQVNFGACAAAHIFGNVNVSGPAITISGSAPVCLLVTIGTVINFAALVFNTPIIVTLSGTPAFSSAFASASHGVINVPSSLVSFSGPATGSRYSELYGALINTNGGGSTFFPGNSAGSVDSTSVYV